MEEEEFNIDIAVLNVFDGSDSEHDAVEESLLCLLSFNDLKLVSNKSVLGQESSFKVLKYRPFVQVLHDGNAPLGGKQYPKLQSLGSCLNGQYVSRKSKCKSSTTNL